MTLTFLPKMEPVKPRSRPKPDIFLSAFDHRKITIHLLQ